MILGITLFFAGLIHIDKAYPSYTFILTALFIFTLYLFIKFFSGFDAASFLISYLIILIPFLMVNGVLTAIPVVWYNDTENLGIRILSILPYPFRNIPFEDIFYGMLLILMNISIYEKLRSGHVSY